MRQSIQFELEAPPNNLSTQGRVEISEQRLLIKLNKSAESCATGEAVHLIGIEHQDNSVYLKAWLDDSSKEPAFSMCIESLTAET